jgi:hypothetical protein
MASELGSWIIVAALAGGTVAGIPMLTARGRHRAAAALQAPTDAVSAAPQAAGSPDAAAAVASVAVVPAIPSDAGTADAVVVLSDQVSVEPPGGIAPNAILRKSAPIKRAAKGPPTKPTVEDLYDDRN